MSAKTSTNGFVLAGGKSRRMGRDKAQLEWGKVSLLEHMTQLLSTVCARVQIVGRGDFPDRIPGKGPLGGILTALETTEHDRNLFVAVDLPLLTPHFLRTFDNRFASSSKPIIACRVGGQFALCLGIRPSLSGDVAHRIQTGNLAIQSFVAESEPEILEEDELMGLGIDPKIFANINTSDDLTKFR